MLAGEDSNRFLLIFTHSKKAEVVGDAVELKKKEVRLLNHTDKVLRQK